MTPYHEVGDKLVSNGYCAVPVVPGYKKPGIYSSGAWHAMPAWTTRYLSQLPNAIERHTWNRAPEAGVCVILGRSSGHLVAVDVDIDECVESVMAVLPETRFQKRGAKGLTLFYRSHIPPRPFDRVLDDGRRERMVDFLSEGRQTLLPPTLHPETGNPYEWVGEGRLEDSTISDMPWLPDNAIELIEAALAPFGYSKDRQPHRNPSSEPGKALEPTENANVFRELNEAALANLPAWVPWLGLYKLEKVGNGYKAVADWRSSTRGRPLNQRAQNLSLSPAGIKDFGADKGYTPIDLVMKAHTHDDFDRAFAWLNERVSVGLPPVEVRLKAKPAQVDVVASDEHEEPAPVAEAAAPEQEIKPWRRKPESIDLTSCPGLVGDIADWIVSTAEFQQPLLAIGSGLALVSVVCGRQIIGPTQSGTHLYIVGVAPTGAGKDWPMTAISRILDVAGMDRLVGPGRFTADSAIVHALTSSPRIVSLIDEIGQFLARGKSRSASTHEQGISALLRSLWSAGPGAMKMTGRANADAVTLYAPALTIFGVSTAGELFDNLTKADISNGLLNRFLILKNETRPSASTPKTMRHEIPDSIVDKLRAIKVRLGDLADSQFSGTGTTRLTAEPHHVPWASEEAEQAYQAIRVRVAAAMEADPRQEMYLARSAEMAVRIATVRAVGINPQAPAVTVDDLAWAEALVMQSVAQMFEEADEKVAENDRERYSKRVIRYLERVRKGESRKVAKTKRDIHGHIGTTVAVKYLTEILDGLISVGAIEEVDITDPSKHTKKVMGYRLV
jgi:hypothetical protein